MVPRHSLKCKILLDEGLPPRNRFKSLNNYFNVKHIKHDLKSGGETDKEVYAIAAKDHRILVTFNLRDFQIQIKSDQPTIIGLSDNLNNQQIDSKLTSFLKLLPNNKQKGPVYKINVDTIVKDSVKED